MHWVVEGRLLMNGILVNRKLPKLIMEEMILPREKTVVTTEFPMGKTIVKINNEVKYSKRSNQDELLHQRALEVQRKYYYKHREEILKKQKTEAYKEYLKKYTSENKEKIKERAHKWYLEHKETINGKPKADYAREWTHRTRLELFNLLGNKCVQCGEIDWRCLQIDHINGGGCKERKELGGSSKYYRYLKKKISSGSKEYQLLCANCNWKKKYSSNEVWRIDNN